MSIATSPEHVDVSGMSYKEGQTLSIALHLECGSTCTITTEVLKLHEPFTLSCVLTVEVLSTDASSIEIPAQAILKLFDRRSSTQLRSDEEIDAWSEAAEQAFVEFVSSGDATVFIGRLRKDDDFEGHEEGWSAAEKEAYLYDRNSNLLSTEVRAYDILRQLQGKHIPELYSAVSIVLNPDVPNEQLLTINGSLLKCIPGPTLSEMKERVPREKWQSLVDSAVEIVRSYSLLGIRNKDVRPSNFIVYENVPHGHERRVVMINFALCDFRESDWSEADWGESQMVTR